MPLHTVNQGVLLGSDVNNYRMKSNLLEDTFVTLLQYFLLVSKLTPCTLLLAEGYKPITHGLKPRNMLKLAK